MLYTEAFFTVYEIRLCLRASTMFKDNQMSRDSIFTVDKRYI